MTPPISAALGGTQPLRQIVKGKINNAFICTPYLGEGLIRHKILCPIPALVESDCPKDRGSGLRVHGLFTMIAVHSRGFHGEISSALR